MKNTNKNMMYTFWSGAILLCLALVAVVLVFTNAVGNTGSPKAEATPAVTETPTPTPQANPISPIQSSAALAQTEDKGSTYVDQIYFLGDKSLKVLQSESMLTGKDAAKQVWIPDTGSLPASSLDTAKYNSPVTGTVASIPLIVSSIMSKKLAAGADIIVLDVKCGSGSFMKTLDDARELATEMVEIGKMAGRKTVAVITDMDEPLGHAVGNALEVKEAIAALRAEYKSELLELCLTLGSCILTQAGMAADDAAARAMLEQTITDGSALKKLAEFVAAQDGDPAAIYDPSRLPMAPVQMEVPSPASGYVRHIAATDVGLVSMRLGGGRATKDSVIDHSVGIVLRKKVDEPVTAGESLATIHAADEAAARRAVAELAACYTITPDAPPAEPFIKAIIR